MKKLWIGGVAALVALVGCQQVQRQAAAVPDNQEYDADYIVVGAGAAGGVLASRLAENKDITVLVLEAGPDNTDEPYIKDLASALLLWGMPAGVGPDPSPSNWDFETTPQAGKVYAYPRGTGLGGSVNHHAGVDGRGTPVIYNEWAKITGDKSWRYENLVPYFKKMENFGGADVDPKVHGKTGWLRVQQGPIASAYNKALVQAAKSEWKIDLRKDMYDNPDDFSGMHSLDWQMHDDGTRSYVATDLLLPTQKENQKRGWNNLMIKTDTLVTKVIIEDGKAVGVEAIAAPRAYQVDDAHIPASKDGKRVTYRAKKGVILSGGAINTPQLLMLSGIGPKKELQKLGIPVVDDRPGVGRNLQDHMEVTVVFDVKHPGMDKDPLDAGKWRRAWLIMDWHSDFDARDPRHPDLHFHVMDAYFRDFNLDPAKFNDPDPLKASYINEFVKAFDKDNPTFYTGFLIEVLKPKAKSGSITLASTDPTAPPIIDLQLNSEDDDLTRMALGMQMAREVMANPIMAGYEPEEVLPGAKVKTLDQLKDYIKRYSAFGHHISGTAKMGKESDPMAVVNSNLQVIGVEDLWVADASIFPTVPGYNTSRPAYLIGEVAPEKILATSK